MGVEANLPGHDMDIILLEFEEPNVIPHWDIQYDAQQHQESCHPQRHVYDGIFGDIFCGFQRFKYSGFNGFYCKYRICAGQIYCKLANILVIKNFN